MCDYANEPKLGTRLRELAEDAPDVMAGMGAQQAANLSPRRWSEPSPSEQADKAAAHHAEQHQKASEAAAFFRNNPAFDEFIKLVRKGSIQF